MLSGPLIDLNVFVLPSKIICKGFLSSIRLNILNGLIAPVPGTGSVQFSSVTQSCPTLCNPMNCSMPGLPVHHQLPEFTQTHVHRVSDAIKPSHPLSAPSLLPPIPPSIRVFSNESALHMRWPKYWSFSISPSKEHPGLISLQSKDSQESSPTSQFKSINSSELSFLHSPALIFIHD